MATSTSGSGMQLGTGSIYVIKPKMMEALISAQKMFGYFRMLNGPTYVNLVKDF